MAERVLFGVLLVLLAGAGFLYGFLKGNVPAWPLAGWLIAYMCASYLLYRIALKFVCRKL